MILGENKWVLTTYAEKTATGDYPNVKHVLDESLAESLDRCRKMFPYEEFQIVVRNVMTDAEPQISGIDFKIVRLEDGSCVGEMEFHPTEYEPEELL